MAGMIKEAFIIEGYLNLESQEGGYVEPAWTIDDDSLAGKVAEYFGVEFVARKDWNKKCPYGPGDQPIGLARITIEQIEKEQSVICG